ncbi:MAG TPA: PQQ-binding-like beta-propeller repeat protein [Symbiobacteriaceae bacterium]|jgi:outer membrane protein assembly factor BamB/LysM repeat protein
MVFYFVQRGETLYAIAKRYQTTVHAIVTANRLEDPNAICAGQALLIPRPGEVPSPPPGGIVHLVRAGETVFGLATKFSTTPHDILRANQIAHPEFILAGQQLVIPEPVEPGDDWPMLGRTPGRVGAGPVVLHGAPLDGWTFAPRKQACALPSAPVIRYDRIFVGLGDGNFYCLDRNDGRIKWRWTAGEPASFSRSEGHGLATPLIFDGLTYLCGPDGDVTAVDAYTGRQVWRVKTGSVITSSPVAFEGVVYFGAWDEQIYALEAKTGAIAWKRSLEAPVHLPVALGDDHVYAAAEDGMLWSLDAQTGEVCWKAAGPGPRAPIFAEVVVLAGERAYDPQNGTVLWELPDPGSLIGAVPVARLDRVIYPGGVVDLFTGKLVRPDDPPGLPIRQSVATGSIILGVGSDQRLYARDAADGRIVWARSLPAPSHQPPAVAAGQVVLALADGTVQTYRFKEESAAG